MTLANLMWGPQHFFWNGRAATLEEQALVPLQHADEMAQDDSKKGPAPAASSQQNDADRQAQVAANRARLQAISAKK